MAYGKDDFIDFSDLDLEDLLGDFTSSEIESDEDCKDAKQKANKPCKLYECDKCDRTYASISGLRGHLRTKHGVSNVKVCEYRQGQKTSKDRHPFCIDESELKDFFTDAFSMSLHEIQNNNLRKKTAKGKVIVDMAEALSTSTTVKQEVMEKMLPHYLNVFKKASPGVGNTNETLYSTFYQLTEDLNLNSEIQHLLKTLSEVNSRPFVGVLLHSLMRTLVKRQSELFGKHIDESVKHLSENEQRILFYISGYIINSLTRKSLKETSGSGEKLLSLKEAMQQSLKNESDSERNFVSKFAEWTTKTNRGGLKVPSDNFFLLVRECEMCCRDEVGESHLNKDSLNKVVLREKIMDRFMVKHYPGKIFSGLYESFILESCINIFLTVRGHAWARKRKSEEQLKGTMNKKALRKSLIEYSNK